MQHVPASADALFARLHAQYASSGFHFPAALIPALATPSGQREFTTIRFWHGVRAAACDLVIRAKDFSIGIDLLGAYVQALEAGVAHKTAPGDDGLSAATARWPWVVRLDLWGRLPGDDVFSALNSVVTAARNRGYLVLNELERSAVLRSWAAWQVTLAPFRTPLPLLVAWLADATAHTRPFGSIAQIRKTMPFYVSRALKPSEIRTECVAARELLQRTNTWSWLDADRHDDEV